MNTFYFTQRTSARIFTVIALFSLIAGMLPAQAFANAPVEGETSETESSETISYCHVPPGNPTEAKLHENEPLESWNGHKNHKSDFIVNNQEDKQQCLDLAKSPVVECPQGEEPGPDGECQGGGICPEESLSDDYPTCGNSEVTDCDEGYVLSGDECVLVTSPEVPTCTVTIVSDTSDFVVEKNANAQALSYVHPNWTKGLSPATWIWGDDPVDLSNFVPQTFQKKFGFIGTVTSATLEVASDNTHSAVVNIAPAHIGGSSFGTPVPYNVASEIKQGNNELNITVTNLVGASNPQDNPAGLKYKLTIHGTPNEGKEGCATAYVPPVVDVCSNIEGPQASIPKGYHRGEGNACVKDVPPVCKVGKNLLSNGSFETPVASANSYGAGLWQIFASVPNWAISNDGLELWNNVLGGASDGAQNAELDGNSPSTITQTVATVPGATYELRFDFSARPGTGLVDNNVDAKADGTLVTNASADGSALTTNAWTPHSNTFVAGDSSTDISFSDKGSNNSLGSLIDNAVLCYVAPPVDFCPNIEGVQLENSGYIKDKNGKCYMPIESCSLSVVSDTSNEVNDSGAFIITPHPAWVPSITGSLAKWIWGTAEGTAVDGVTDETQTFTKTFVWSGDPSTAVATLKISSDNGYSVKLNGVPVGADASEFNYQSVDTISLTGSIIQGVNTLEISVTNKANGVTLWSANPAGLLYDLTIKNTTGACGNDGGGGSDAVFGCMNPLATNFNIAATVDNESCVFEEVVTSGGGGGGGGGTRVKRAPSGEVLGASTTNSPEGQVLGDQVTAVPAGAPNAGAGSTSPFALSFYGVAPVAFIRRTRVHG